MKEQNLSIPEQADHLAHGCVDVLTKDGLVWKLEKAEREKRSLVVKYGVDPTAPDIHLGHTVPIRKLRQFQELRHTISFLIGDFTGKIGDPTGRSTGRKAMTDEEVLANAESYKRQVFKILDPELTTIVYNSEWLNPLKLDEIIHLLAGSTVNKLVKRNSFVKRFEAGEAVSGHELIYPFLQAYDSVFLYADVELGGTDQYFNLIFGRGIQPHYGQEPQIVLTTPLLEGLDGNEKMSKSLGNTVGIDEPAQDMYAGIMRLKDELMIKYFDYLTDIDQVERGRLEVQLAEGRIHPMDLKKRLARDITAQYHSARLAQKAEEEFMRVYSQRGLPSDMPLYTVRQDETDNGNISAVDLMRKTGLASSNSAARRLIAQRGFKVSGEVVEDPYKKIRMTDDLIINVGKITYVRIRYAGKDSET